jgi:hypothetical protein
MPLQPDLQAKAPDLPRFVQLQWAVRTPSRAAGTQHQRHQPRPHRPSAALLEPRAAPRHRRAGRRTRLDRRPGRAAPADADLLSLYAEAELVATRGDWLPLVRAWPAADAALLARR